MLNARSRTVDGLGLALALAVLLAPLHQPLASAAWLAWPAAALLWSGLGCLLGVAGHDSRWQHYGRALVRLALAWLAVAVLAVWPLAGFLARPGLGTLLRAAAGFGLAWSLLWWGWPELAAAVRGEPSPARRPTGVGGVSPPPATRLPSALLALLALLPLPLLLALPLPPAWREFVLIAQAVLLPAVALAAVLPARSRPVREPAPRKAAAAADAAGIAAHEPETAATAGREERLYLAAAAGRVEEALALLAEGADAHALPAPDDRDQRTLAMLAAVLPDLRLLRALIAAGVDLNRAHAGLTPLLAATRDSWHGRAEAVTMLLANGAEPRLADPEGHTPLHHAARSTDPAVAAALLDAGAAIDALNREGLTPLAMACAVGNWRLARLLLERGAACEPAAGQPVLLAAAGGEDDAAGVALLRHHRARVDACDGEGRSALLVASRQGNAEIVRALLEAGADVDRADSAGVTPLLAAAAGGHLTVLQRLAAAGANPRACLADGRNALAVLAGSGTAEPECVAVLLALGVDPDRPDRDGRLPLQHLVAAGRWRLVLALDPQHPLPASLGEELAEVPGEHSPRELLRQALLRERLDSAAQVAVQAPLSAAEGNALLLELASRLSREAVGWLLDHGADCRHRDSGGDTLPMRLLDQGESAAGAIARLLERGETFAGAGGLARFLRALRDGRRSAPRAERLAIALLERGADPFAPVQGEPALVRAVALGFGQLAQALLERGLDPNVRDRRGLSALHLASAAGDEATVRALIFHGAAPERPAPDGQTACGLALAAGHRHLVRWLEWPRWRPPGRRLRPDDLPAAAMIGDVEAVTALLDLGVPIDARDAQGCTALLRASGGGHGEAVDLLLERGADPALAAATGATPLSAAISMRQEGIVTRLLAAGAAPDQPLPGGITPLMLACALGFPELAGRLLSAGAVAGSRDEQGLTALHCAAMYAFQARDAERALRAIDLLLAAGAEPDGATAAGHTPLLLALGGRAEPGTGCREDVVLAAIERLLAAGASLHVREYRGFGPLHLAALHGLAGPLRRLLAAGADPDQRDRYNRPPREIALLRGFVDIAAEFEPLRAAPPPPRFTRRPPPP